MSKYFLTVKVSNIKRTSNLENYSLAKEKKIHQKLVFKSTKKSKRCNWAERREKEIPNAMHSFWPSGFQNLARSLTGGIFLKITIKSKLYY